MLLPAEAINEFIELYFKHYKIKLSYEEASFRFNNLVSLYEAVYGNMVAEGINDNERDENKSK